jgi:hypothetical protein
MTKTSIPLVVVGVGISVAYFFQGVPRKIGFFMIPIGIVMLLLDSRS